MPCYTHARLEAVMKNFSVFVSYIQMQTSSNSGVPNDLFGANSILGDFLEQNRHLFRSYNFKRNNICLSYADYTKHNISGHIEDEHSINKEDKALLCMYNAFMKYLFGNGYSGWGIEIPSWKGDCGRASIEIQKKVAKLFFKVLKYLWDISDGWDTNAMDGHGYHRRENTLCNLFLVFSTSKHG